MNHGDHHYFVLHTSDLAASSEFFHHLLGWEIDGGEIVDSNFPGALAETHDRALWVHVDDCRRTVDRVAELGGQPGELTESESGTNATCRDDQGNVFHLGTLIPEYRNGDRPARRPVGELGYATFPMGDTGQAVEFHGKLFGWTFTGPGEAGIQTGYRHCTNGALEFGFTASGDVSPSLYFQVDDAEAIADTVTSLGGRHGGLVESANGVTLTGCIDPAGVRFELWQAPAERR